MSVAERLILLALLGHLQAPRPSALGQMAFITDGPLALFGEVAPIKRPLLRRLQRVAGEQAAAGLRAAGDRRHGEVRAVRRARRGDPRAHPRGRS